MKKKLPTTISVVATLYIIIFVIIMIYTTLLPTTVYNNQKLLSKNMNSANKINYKASRQDDVTKITCSKMQGMDIIWEDTVYDDTIRQMYYNLNVKSGKAKLILIQPDDTIITLIEQNGTENENHQVSESSTADASDAMWSDTASEAALDLKKGKNRMKIVCDKGTAFSLSFKVSE